MADIEVTSTVDTDSFTEGMASAQKAVEQAMASIRNSTPGANAALDGVATKADLLRAKLIAIGAAKPGAVISADLSEAGNALENLGLTASLAARKLSALVDEALAGRWRQFDGTLASVVARLASANPVMTAMGVAATAAAAAIGYLAYQWLELQRSINAAQGEMLITGQLTDGSNMHIQSWIDRLKQGYDANSTSAQKAATELATLGGSAARFAGMINEIAGAESTLMGGDVSAYVKEIVKAFNEGSQGALKWADAHHILSEAQHQDIETMVKAGEETNAFAAILGAAMQRFGSQGAIIADNRKKWEEYMDTLARMGEGAMFMDPAGKEEPKGQLAPQPPQKDEAAQNPAIAEQEALINKVNTALNTRAVLTKQLTDAETALTRIQHDNAASADDEARAAEAVATIRQKLQEVHTVSEAQGHQTRLQYLQEELAANKDFADNRIKILQDIASEEKNYYGAQSAQARAASNAVSAGIREAADKDLQVKIDALKADQTAHEGDFKYQEQIEDKILAMLKQHYSESSAAYQTESRRRQEIFNQEAKQEEEIAKNNAQTQVELGQIAIQKTAESVKEAKSKFPSLLEILGGKDESAQFQAQLQQITSEYQQAMLAIQEAQRKATNPAELQAALNRQEVITAKYDLDVTKLQQKAALATQQAWTNVFQSMETRMNSSIKGIINGTQTGSQAIVSILEGILDQTIEIPLQLAENWINAELMKWLGIKAADTGGLATQKAMAMSQIQTDAAVAFAGAYSSAAAIPYVGWMIAPEAAMAAYSAVQASSGMAALDVGAWDVPQDMVAQIHKGESVVPTDFATGMRQNGAFGGGGDGSGGMVVHFSPQVTAMDGASVQAFFNANMKNLAASFGKYLVNNPSMRPRY